MIKPESNAPSPMQPWVRTTDEQIAALEAQVAQLASLSGVATSPDHEQNRGISDTFSFTELSDGTLQASSAAMSFSGSVEAQAGVAVDGTLAVGNLQRQEFNPITGEAIGSIPNFEVTAGQYGNNPVTEVEYYTDGKLNVTDTTLNVNGYGQINGDGLAVTLMNSGAAERANVSIVTVSGTGTEATYQIENNATNIALYTPGKYVNVSGINPDVYNGENLLITSVDIVSSPMKFVVSSTATGAYVAGGYVTISQPNSLYEGKLSVMGPAPSYNGVTINSGGVFVGPDGGDPASYGSFMSQDEIYTPALATDNLAVNGYNIYVSATAPASPSNNDIWINPEAGKARAIDYSTKNHIINSDFSIWQRGTSGLITATAATNGYTADRWQLFRASYTAGATCSRVAGPNQHLYGIRVQRDAGNTSLSNILLYNNFETINSVPLAGQVVTFSAWIKKGANYAGTFAMRILSGTGTDQRVASGYTGSVTVASFTRTLTTEWQRFSVTGVVPANATQIAVGFQYTPSTSTAGADDWFDVSGTQLELGASVNPYQMHSGSVAEELAACQRYYYRVSGVPTSSPYTLFGMGVASSTTSTFTNLAFPVAMRIAPSSLDTTATASDYRLYSTAGTACSALPVINQKSEHSALMQFTVASGLTAGAAYHAQANNTSAAYLGFNAEI